MRRGRVTNNTMSIYIEAFKSGWRAGLKQYRKRLTELRKARQ